MSYYVAGELSSDGSTIKIENHKSILIYLQSMIGKRLSVNVELNYKERSPKQNRYLHGVILPCIINFIKETSGETYSKESVKAFIYTKILGYELVSEEFLGETVYRLKGKHFSDMNTKEFGVAVELLRGHFAPQGLEIPEPTGDNFLADYVGYK